MLTGMLKIGITTHMVRKANRANVINKVSIVTNLPSDCDIEME